MEFYSKTLAEMSPPPPPWRQQNEFRYSIFVCLFSPFVCAGNWLREGGRAKCAHVTGRGHPMYVCNTPPFSVVCPIGEMSNPSSALRSCFHVGRKRGGFDRWRYRVHILEGEEAALLLPGNSVTEMEDKGGRGHRGRKGDT